MYHQNLGGRRFTNLTFELLYETPRQFSSPFGASAGLKSPRDARPSYLGRSTSRGSSRSSSSGSSVNIKRRHASQTHAPMPLNATTKIAAAAAFAEEKERIEHEAKEAREAAEKEEAERERGRRKERVSNATTINGGEVVHEVGMKELEKEIGGPLPTQDIHIDDEEEEGEQAARNRKSSATLSIVLQEFEKEMKGERSRAAPVETNVVGEYTENVESRIPNVPYKSVTHPDVAQARTDDPLPTSTEGALAKPTWRKQPLEKISAKTQKMKQKIDTRTTSIREKIPFFRNGSTMDRIKETFKFSRFTHRN